jgi:hypothetical protein
VRDQPLSLQVDVVPLSQLMDDRTLGLQLEGRLGEAGLTAELSAPLPVGTGTADLRVQAHAAGLDEWNNLLDLNLPPWGPVELAGDLENTRSGYRLEDFRFAVGESELRGAVDANLENKPRIDVRLSAPLIQLQDFRTGDWRATRESNSEVEREPADLSADGSLVAPDSPLVSRRTFDRLDATLVLDVEEVRSGSDRLGAGELRARLLDGVFEVPQLLVRTEGGDVTASGRLAWVGAELLDSSLALRADNFDYGILARRIDPDSDMKGRLTVNADLRGRRPVEQPFMSTADGVLQFGVWPENFRAGIFDLWAVGLLSAVMPKFSSDAVSTMNCLIGKFRLTGGVLSEESFLADSSKIQVTGDADADFRVREVDAYLSPEAKRAQIFSLGVPVEITGGFDDYHIGVRSGDLALAILRFVTSPVVAPIRWLVEDPLPADGEAACRSAWEGAVSPAGEPGP